MSDQEIELIIKAKDEATAKLKTVTAALSDTEKASKKAASTATESSLSFGKLAGAVGLGGIAANAAMSAYGSFTSFLKGTVSAAAEAQAGQAQLAAVLTSTGGAAGVTAAMANDLAGSLARTTTFTDDQILSAENLALTFTNIGKDVFPGFIQSVLDVSTAMGQDLKSSVVQLGKAFNDPVEGMSALTRVGVTFNDQQKKQVETLMKQGKVLEAQGVLQKELSREFAGSAAAAANTYDGQMKRLNNTMGEIQENIGMQLLPVLSSATDTFLNVALGMQDATAAGTDYSAKLEELKAKSKAAGDSSDQTTKKIEAFAEQERNAAAQANNFSTTLYDMWTMLKLLAHAFLATVYSIAGFATAVVGAVGVWAIFIKDILKGFAKMATTAQNILPKIGEAIVKGLTGKGDEAKAILSGIIKDSFDVSDTKAAAAAVWGASKSFFDEAAKEAAKAQANFDEIGKRGGYKPAFITPTVKGGGGNLDATGPGGGASGAKKQKEEAEKLKSLWYDLGKLGDSIKEKIDEAKKKTEEWREITKMQEDAYAEVGRKLEDAGIEVAGITDKTKTLERTHAEALKGLIDDMKRYGDEAITAKNKVAEISEQITNLQKAQNEALAKNTEDTTRTAAGQVAELQKKIDDANKTLKEAGTFTNVYSDIVVDPAGNKLDKVQLGSVFNKEISQDERAKLEMEIIETQKILNKHRDFIKANDEEIKRAKDLLNMDEIARTIALGDEKSAQIKKEYDEKIAAAEAEKALEQKKYDDALAALQSSNEKIAAENEAAKKDYAKYLLANSDLSNSYIQTEINKYNQLAAAIRNSAKGVSSKFTPEESALLTAFKKSPTDNTGSAPDHRAMGGPVTAGTPYVVGEHGPELFTPRNSGAITPNSSMGAVEIHMYEGAQVSAGSTEQISQLADMVAERLARVMQAQRNGLAASI